jgi:hypothetical protein
MLKVTFSHHLPYYREGVETKIFTCVEQVLDFVTNLRFQFLKTNQKHKTFGFGILTDFTIKAPLVPGFFLKQIRDPMVLKKVISLGFRFLENHSHESSPFI